MTSTSTRRGWSVARVAIGAGAVAATALLALAVPASAHVPNVKAECKDGKTTLSVVLTKYVVHQGKTNTVQVTDGEQTLQEETNFGTSFSKTFETDGSVDHAFVVTVKAWDDPKGEKGWSFVKRLPVTACVTPTTTTTVPPTETTTTTVSETTVPPTETTTTTTAAPVTTTTAVSGGLADTGASIAIPLVLGALLLVGGGALVLLTRRRGRA